MAVHILSSTKYCIIQNDYARKLLKLFVTECLSIYGSYFLSFNVHNLIYMCDDVLLFGSLPNFSAYPFENFLQSVKKLLRKSNQALQQIVKRLVEKTNRNLNSKKGKIDNRRRLFRVEHDSGPLLPNFMRSTRQYKEMYCGPWFLSCRIPDNCIYLVDSSVVLIENFARKADGDFIIGRLFNRKVDLMSYPVPSSPYDNVRVSELSEMLSFSLSSVKCKEMRLPCFDGGGIVMDGTNAIFPILMEENSLKEE